MHAAYSSTRFNAEIPACRKDALVDPHHPNEKPHGAVSADDSQVTCRACRKAKGLPVVYAQATESNVASILSAVARGTNRPANVSKHGSSWVVR